MSDRTIFKALSAVQKSLAARGISKGDENTYDGYKFRGIDAVLNTLAPVFAENGVLLIPSQQSCEIRTITTAQGKPMNHCKVIMDFTFYDEHGDSITHAFPGEAMDRGDKSVNKACTAAYKYFLFEAFCIPVEGTPDADGESHEVGEPLVTQADYEALTAVMAKDNGFDLLSFRDGYDEEAWNELFNLAPHGQKTKVKQTVRDLERKAHAVIDDYVTGVRDALERSDEVSLQELVGELEPIEKTMLWGRLTDIEKHQIKQMMESAA